MTHLRGRLELFSFGPFSTRLVEPLTVIRYDKPGCGLSDRAGIDLSFDAQAAVAVAVADAAGAGRFSLFGASQGGQIAAARYPERVGALVLYGMCADGGDLHRSPGRTASVHPSPDRPALLTRCIDIRQLRSMYASYRVDWVC